MSIHDYLYLSYFIKTDDVYLIDDNLIDDE
jgi:hypothetical protein